MTTSDKIQLFGIVISALTSIIAIFISVHTLRQNSKMIEDSSRPYIGIYGLSTYICDRYYYIIIKNFGQSIAHIESLTYDFDLAKLALRDGLDPFGNIDGTSLAPGQSYRCAMILTKYLQMKSVLSISISSTHQVPIITKMKSLSKLMEILETWKLIKLQRKYQPLK